MAATSVRVTLVGREGCHLCGVAREVVERVCGELGIGWEEVDVDTDPALLERWSEEVPVTLVDGLVLARTPFHNSMNYRCVVVRGRGRRVEEPAEHQRALRIITDHIVATWDHGRAPSSSDLRRTLAHPDWLAPFLEQDAARRQA